MARYGFLLHVSLPYQLHVVHQGGQLYASGPVADSVAAAAGADVHGTVARDYRASLELFGLVSRNVPDRSRSDLSQDGVAFFARAQLNARAGAATSLPGAGGISSKTKEIPTTSPCGESGERYQGIRDYSEAGLTRGFALAPMARLEVSGRFHRVENFQRVLVPHRQHRVAVMENSVKVE